MSNTANSLRSVPAATTILIAVNLVAFAFFWLVPGTAGIYDAGALSLSALEEGQWWTLLTSMFLHGGVTHIACNMISLYYLGMMMEPLCGKGRYLALYFISGVVGGLAYCAWNLMMGDPSSAVGASGAIFGLFGTYGYVLLRESRDNRLLAVRPDSQDLTSYAVMLMVNIVFGLTAANIANAAHVGGLVSGFLIAVLMYPSILKRFGR